MDDEIGPVSDTPGCDAILEDETVCDVPCTVHVLGYSDKMGMACFKSCDEHEPWIGKLVEVWATHRYDEDYMDVECVYALRLNAKWN